MQAFEPLASGIYLEGLAVDEATGDVWYSDVIGGGVHGLRPDGRALATLDAERRWIGGILMNADGSVLSTGQGGIRWNHPGTGSGGWLLTVLETGEPINGVNELVPDGKGGIFFGTLDIASIIEGQPTKPTALYRLTRERTLIKLDDGLRFCNGLAFDPGRRRLYCNETFSQCTVYDVDGELRLHNRRVFAARDDVDGIALDAEGNVWITGVTTDGIARYTPDGQPLAPYAAGMGPMTQLRFGGPDRCDVYCLQVPADAGETLKVGGQLTAQASALWLGRSEIPGMSLGCAAFDLG